MVKTCAKCGLLKSISEFYQRKKHRAGEYYERCKACFKERGRKYYQDNHTRQLLLALRRKERYRTERKMFIENFKRNKPCLDCGNQYPVYVMDFDHREGSSKVASISWMSMHSTANLEKIKLEIEKCDLVCANCHRIRTHDRIQRQKLAAVANVVKAPV